MDLQIRNFGAIENADVKFDGLTVIAGENDTGKSTVGKLVFAVIKAISRYEQDLEVGKERRVRNLVEDLYRKLRGIGYLQVDSSNGILEQFLPRNFLNELRPSIINQYDKDAINPIFEDKKILIKGVDIEEGEFFTHDDLFDYLDRIKLELIAEEDKQEVSRTALKKALISEFHSEFTPTNTKKRTRLRFNEGKKKIFEVFGKENQVSEFNIYDEIPPFEDVTLIESPIFIQLYEILQAAGTLLSDQRDWFNVALHIKDLINKIKHSKALTDNEFYSRLNLRVIKEIHSVIDGTWSFDEDKPDFIFTRNGSANKQNFRSINTASGIKSFGIIQLLLLAEILNNRSLLIIDEPETHLHPKWQVEYAKIICLLVKHEIPVLLTSHSPYLIQALRHYSEEYGIERFTNYYLAERNDNGLVDIEHVNDDLNRVFTKLSQPLQELVWQ